MRRSIQAPSRAREARARPVLSALANLVAIVHQILALPWRVWLGAAEVVGEFVLSAWEAVALPLLELILSSLRAALRFLERAVTPARGLAVVALGATIALGASQFSHYRAVQVGADSYRGVQNLAPAPEVDQQSPRSAHGVTVFAIAIAGLFVTVFAITRNWRLARLLTILGVAVILISLLVDAPQGLREGSAAIDYQGAKATLLGGFWVQLWSGVTLALVGPLLAAQLRAQRAARHPRQVRELGAPGVASTFPASPRSSDVEGATT